MYLSQRTDANINTKSPPNALLVATAELCEWRVAAAEAILNFSDADQSQQVKVIKTILHPGEVNKIREVPGHSEVVVTHTDSKELYVWHTGRQPNRKEKVTASAALSVADLTLIGHTADAEFALGVATAAPLVASGGKDKSVMVWNLADADGGALLARADPDAVDPNPKADAGRAPSRLDAQSRLKGHTDTVEDVVWRPDSAAELASVGDDRALLFWDTRAAHSPAGRVPDAHGPAHDLHCVDWSALQPHLVATGAADGSVRVWDKRELARPLHIFAVHVKPTMRMEWSPTHEGVLASGGEDRRICIWDLNRGAGGGTGDGDAKRPPQLMFLHSGHRGGVADFQWVPGEPADPFTMASVSDNGVGGTLQLWRINDMIWRPEDVVLAELEEHRDFILNAKNKKQAPAVTPL
ncbi:hypothetical protein WJX81_006464 [Elliptochloris bilobata]|uniref:Uncharacterized protein n=1 Tax=Elliptochloris bilobata TaxID=381761 RepID=A0AAW1RY76_9CHLO